MNLLLRTSRQVRVWGILSVILFLPSFALAANCGVEGDDELAQCTAATELKVVSYNVLNLFDNEHDEGKEDWTFLPKGAPGKDAYCKIQKIPYYREECEKIDWTEERLSWKLSQIAKVIRLQGDLPDLLAVSEIENERVAGMLAKVLGYSQFKVTDSGGSRGIDVCLFYKTDKIKFLESEEIVVKGSDFESHPTRNILRVHFSLKAQPTHVLGVYVNHWPSQTAGPSKRVVVAENLQKAIDQHTNKVGSANYSTIVVGDFNTVEKESPNAFDSVLESATWKNALIDAQKTGMAGRHPLKSKMPVNSYFYPSDNSWDKLDRILFSANASSTTKATGGIEFIPNSFRIVAAKTLTKIYEFTNPKSPHFGKKVPMVPIRYNFFAENEKEVSGYSDHLPVVAKFKLRASKPKKATR